MRELPTMSPELFVKKLFEKVIESNIKIYKDIYFNPKISNADDAISKEILDFTNGLPEDKKEAAVLFARQAMVDTCSNILGIIDGISEFYIPADRFELLYCKKIELGGDLQALFLEEDEERR